MIPPPKLVARRHLLFIDEQLNLGGIATLIARVSRLLLRDGWEITLICQKLVSEARQTLPDKIVIHELGNRFKRLYFPEYALYTSRKLGIDSVDLIYATGVVAGWLGSIFSTYLVHHPPMVFGVYTPWEYCYPSPRDFSNFGSVLRCAHFDRQVPDSCKLFMSEVVRQHHVLSLGRSLDDAPICVLPIDAAMFANPKRAPNRYKVVSVGRLCNWKTYNLYMIDVVDQLLARGYPIEWHVYGVGELEPEMRSRIQSLGLEKNVLLHGNLEYRLFPSVLEDAGAFVGMGTSIVEASFLGVPSVIALENSESQKTYGYLYDLPLGACGERYERIPELETVDLLESLILLSDEDYKREMVKTWEYVQPFEQKKVYQHLLACFENAQPCQVSYWKYFFYNLHGIYRKLLSSVS